MKAKYYLSFMVMALSLTSASAVFAQQVSDDFKASIGKRKSQTNTATSESKKNKKNAKAAQPAKQEEEKNLGLGQVYVGGEGVNKAFATENGEEKLKFAFGGKGMGIAPLSQSDSGVFKTYFDYRGDASVALPGSADGIFDLRSNGDIGIPMGLSTQPDDKGRSLFLGFRPGVDLDFTMQNHQRTEKVTISDPLRGDVEIDQTHTDSKGYATGGFLIGGRLMFAASNDIKVIGGVDRKFIFAATDEQKEGQGWQYGGSVITPSIQAVLTYGTYDLDIGKKATEFKIAANAKVYESKKKDFNLQVGGAYRKYAVDGLTPEERASLTVGVGF